MLQSQLFSAIGKSFYSADLYRHVAREWRGYGFSYLFALLFLALMVIALKLSYVIYSINFHVDYSQVEDSRDWYYSPYPFIEEEVFTVMQMVDQLPEITITKGKLSIDDEVPYTIDHPETHDTFIIIDTSGETKDLRDTPAHVLITADTVMFRNHDGSIRTYSLADVDQFILNQYTTVEWLTKIRNFLAWMVMLVWLPIMALLLWGMHVLISLFYGLAGLGFSSLLKTPLPYEALVRIATVAMTPAVLVLTAFKVLFFHLMLPYQDFLLISLELAYLGFGIWANRATSDNV